jgi:hypothetical protein
VREYDNGNEKGGLGDTGMRMEGEMDMVIPCLVFSVLDFSDFFGDLLEKGDDGKESKLESVNFYSESVVVRESGYIHRELFDHEGQCACLLWEYRTISSKHTLLNRQDKNSRVYMVPFVSIHDQSRCVRWELDLARHSVSRNAQPLFSSLSCIFQDRS